MCVCVVSLHHHLFCKVLCFALESQGNVVKMDAPLA